MDKLLTTWGKKIDLSHPLPEYPRPQLERPSNTYLNLNGKWNYTICDDYQVPSSISKYIVVPFSPESLLSSVMKQCKPEQVLWYQKTISLPENFLPENGHLLLHFGAVDQVADVFFNGVLVSHHEGGYLPFTCDVTACAKAFNNTILVRVIDSLEHTPYAYGKQKYKRGGIWYTATSGIWQTVWLEAVPEIYVESIKITPEFDRNQVKLTIYTNQPTSCRVVVQNPRANTVSEKRGFPSSQEITLGLSEHHPWSPEDPYLYRLYIMAGPDSVQSYFAMRKFGTIMHEGHLVFALNNKPYFHNGVLDQGYWSDGLYTAPSDEAMIYDIQTIKSLGFNMIRKHIKIEPLRWYFHCDRLGMLVWQDMVNGGEEPRLYETVIRPFLGKKLNDSNYGRLGRKDEMGRLQYEKDLKETISLLYNCPCIAQWVIFNEGWGQFDANRITDLVKSIDSTRTIDQASGWYDQGGGDVDSHHIYFRKIHLKNDNKRVLALTEFGGYSYAASGHHVSAKSFGYKTYMSRRQLVKGIQKLYENEVIPLVKTQGLSAAVYTQLSDVEEEVNGLLTFDRAVLKCAVPDISKVMKKLTFDEIVPTTEEKVSDQSAPLPSKELLQRAEAALEERESFEEILKKHE